MWVVEKLGGLAIDEAFKSAKKRGDYVRHYKTNLRNLENERRNLKYHIDRIGNRVREATDRGDQEVYSTVLLWQTEADKMISDVEELLRQSSGPDAEEMTRDVPETVEQSSGPDAEKMTRDVPEIVEQSSGPDAEKMTSGIQELEGQSSGTVDMSCFACTCPNIKKRYQLSKQAEEKIGDAKNLISRAEGFTEIAHHKAALLYKTTLKNLQDEMKNLNHHIDVTENKVHRAKDDGGRVVYPAVLLWQTEAAEMRGDVKKFLGQCSGADAEGMTRDAPEPAEQSSGTVNMEQHYRLIKQAEEKIGAVRTLITQAEGFKDTISEPKPPPQEEEFISNENYVAMNSRTPIFEGIVDALKQPGVNIIGVHGLGGVGKTTLVKEIAKKMRADGTFKCVPLVTVSKDFNVMEIQKKLASELNLNLKAPTDEKSSRNQLWQKFKEAKYLVILDDIWDKVDLKAIGIPIADGCKVVLTSRKEDLLGSTMGANKNFAIETLRESEAWTLFKKEVGDSIESRKEIAYDVCKRCDGLPVAINALGAALRDQPAHAWEDAQKKLERGMITQIEGINPSVWVSLKLSYDLLWSSNAKSCFLLCCLFPEDIEISIDVLTRLCVARVGLLSPNPDSVEEARNSVLTAVDVLKSANLLSNGTNEYGIKENFVRIHDVIRDVGISIGYDDNAFVVEHGVHRWPRNLITGSLYSAISINFKYIKGLPDGLVYPQLHTLLLFNSNFSDVEVPDNFFDGMEQLTALIFLHMPMRRLPSSLAKLTNLRMLYLKGCELEDIAILKDLKSNLEVLVLRDYSIQALPADMRQLTSLRVLDLRYCQYLEVIPQGAISNLTSLEELYFPVDFNFSFLKELKLPLSTGQLSTLHIQTGDLVEGLKFENLKRFCISTGKMPYKFPYSGGTRVLYLGDVGSESSYLRNDLIPLVDKAEILHLANFKDLKKLLHDRGVVGNEFPNLRYLGLESCDEMLHPSVSFNNLTELVVKNCKLKYLLSPTTAKGLAHLERLVLQDCEIMEEIVGFEERSEELTAGEVKFSKLKRLELGNLPNLICFYAEKEKKQTTVESSPTRPQTLFNQQVSLPALNDLIIRGVHEIKKIWDVQPQSKSGKDAQPWCKLGSVNISDCDQLVYAFPYWMLPQLQNLQKLKIEDCKEMEVIISSNKETKGNESIVFPKLEELHVVSLPNLKSFFEATQFVFFDKVSLPALKDLIIWGVHEIKKIWDVPPQSESGKDAQPLCTLRRLGIGCCDQLVYAFPSWMLPRLQNLQELKIEDCKQMEVIISSNKETKSNEIIVFPKLENIWVKSLPNLKSFFEETQFVFFNKVSLPALIILNIWGVSKIKKIWDVQPQSESGKDAQHWCKLGSVHIWDCDQLVYAFPYWMLPQLHNLQELKIDDCKEMEVIISSNKETKGNESIVFPKLEELQVKSLPNLKSFFEATQFLFFAKDMEVIISSNKEAKNNDIIVFPKLEVLWVESLPNLKSFFEESQIFFFDKVSVPALKKLYIENVPKIKKIWDVQPEPESRKDAQPWCKLKYVTVRACDQLVYAFPSWMLPQLQNLYQLTIRSCKDMEVIISSNKDAKSNDIIVFPELWAVQVESLPNLKSLFGEMQLFFSDQDAFPVLWKIELDEHLEIFRNGTSMKEASMEECSTSGHKNDRNGEELDKDLETPTKEVSMDAKECDTKGKEDDHDGEEG